MNITKTQKGFTLIELMIVIAIIGILASIALPTYSDYTNRAKMSEVILAASGCRTEITETIQTGTAMASVLGCERATTTNGVSKYVNAVTVNSNGVISVLTQNLVGGTVTLTPYLADGTTAVTYTPAAPPVAAFWAGQIASWQCDSTNTTLKGLLPSSCKG